jgi:hypothetical protein
MLFYNLFKPHLIEKDGYFHIRKLSLKRSCFLFWSYNKKRWVYWSEHDSKDDLFYSQNVNRLIISYLDLHKTKIKKESKKTKFIKYL